MKRYLIILAFLFVFPGFAAGQEVIPRPVEMKAGNGDALVLDDGVQIIAPPGFLPEAGLLAGLLQERTGYAFPVTESPGKAGDQPAIVLKKDSGSLPAEGYRLESGEQGVTISAAGNPGIYYGGMTLLQLLSPENPGRFGVPAVSIRDEPRFGWRGLMLDCSRTFISPEYLRKTIDRMAFYKLNTLHLHLTDDQGWRLEIKSRPRLTSDGAFFADNYHEPEAFEGFYTQQDIKDLLAYAARRHVRIIPEIEVPGHSGAALHAYPELSCSGRKVPVFPLLSGAPAPPNNVFCAGNENTYRFFKEVLKEVTGLFPAGYVHLGGDEVAKHHWQNCDACQQKIQAAGLKDEEELQRYVMERIAAELEPGGKRPVGWDEIMDGGIGSNWVVMAWQEQKKGMQAARLGHDVVLSPTSHLYFDYNYLTTPTKKVYSFEPFPEDISPDLRERFLGIQANFWSHIARTESRIDFQLYPRTLALAERAWSEPSVMDYEEFSRRKETHTSWLKFFDIKYNGNDDPEPSPYDSVW